MKLEQWDKCERWLLKALELEVSYPEPHYLLVQVYRRGERKAESEAAFLRFQELKKKSVNRPR